MEVTRTRNYFTPRGTHIKRPEKIRVQTTRDILGAATTAAHSCNCTLKYDNCCHNRFFKGIIIEVLRLLFVLCILL